MSALVSAAVMQQLQIVWWPTALLAGIAGKCAWSSAALHACVRMAMHSTTARNQSTIKAVAPSVHVCWLLH
jgi:hypothetical protein